MLGAGYLQSGEPLALVFGVYATSERQPVQSSLSWFSQGGYMKNKALFLAMAIFAASLAGCNTVNGFGKDVERGGEKIQEQTK